MSFDEMIVTLTDRRMIRHKGQVFFMIYDAEEAVRYKELGASVRPVGGQVDPIHKTVDWGAPSWEVHPRTMIEPMIEVVDGEPVDVTADFMLNYFRGRDGFEEGLERILA